jgi:hypothetical protein
VEVDQWIGGGAGWASVAHPRSLHVTHYATEASGMKRRWRVRAVDGAGNAGHYTAWRIYFLEEPAGTGLKPPPGNNTIAPPN